MLAHSLATLDRLIAALLGAGMVLVLPVSLLLFLQWPLRDLVQTYSREANDLAQLLFALYVAMAISYATRRRVHLATDAIAHRYRPATRARLGRVASLCVLAPWSAFILYTSEPMIAQSLRQLEAFPETFNPGYFVVKLALWLLALLVLVQAVLDTLRGPVPEQV
jgi:TRAP-type C4-dicarboxylate transport system permease small subunit